MADEYDSISRLADALLVAEAAYQRARETHERERTVLSKRVLDEARNRLEYLESRAFFLSGGYDELPERCPGCGGRPQVELWSALAAGRALHRGRPIRIAAPLPEWAAEFAIRGTATVSRVSCSSCGAEIAVFSGEPD
jgi:hypothetical protein